MSIRAAVAGIIGCLILPLAASAQQPTPAARLASTVRSEAAKPAFEQALIEVANIGFARADARLEELLQADPEAGVVRALWAGTSRNIPPADRMRELDRAVVQAASGPVPGLLLASAMREGRSGRIESAMVLLDAAARLLPEEPFIEALRISFASGTDAYLRLAEAAHDKFPGYAGVMNHLAYARFRGGFQKEGLEAARRYIEMLPEHPNSHDSYGELLLWSGDLPGAERAFRRTLELDPSWLDGHLGLAGVAMMRGDMRTARTEAEAALATARGPVERLPRLRNVGLAAALTKDWSAARRHLNEAIAEAEAADLPASARDSRLFLAVVEAAAGNAREARATFDACRGLTPRNPYMGAIEAQLGGLLHDEALVTEGLAEMEETAARAGNEGLFKEGVHLSRLVRATLAGDIATARAELVNLKEPSWNATGHAFIARALQRANDRTGAAQELSMMQGLRFDSNSAIALLVSRS